MKCHIFLDGIGRLFLDFIAALKMSLSAGTIVHLTTSKNIMLFNIVYVPASHHCNVLVCVH